MTVGKNYSDIKPTWHINNDIPLETVDSLNILCIRFSLSMVYVMLGCHILVLMLALRNMYGQHYMLAYVVIWHEMCPCSENYAISTRNCSR